MPLNHQKRRSSRFDGNYISNGTVLQILSDDFKEDKQVLTFGPVDEVNAIAEAMAFADKYEAVYSLS